MKKIKIESPYIYTNVLRGVDHNYIDVLKDASKRKFELIEKRVSYSHWKEVWERYYEITGSRRSAGLLLLHRYYDIEKEWNFRDRRASLKNFESVLYILKQNKIGVTFRIEPNERAIEYMEKYPDAKKMEPYWGNKNA